MHESQRMVPEVEAVINNYVAKTYSYLGDLIPEHNLYSKENMALNTLMGVTSHMMNELFDSKEEKQRFIIDFAKSIKKNIT